MTQKLDISHHAIERFISRVNKMATREQAMAAIRESWRGARRLHRHSGDRVLYEANGGAFRLSVAERPHGRMAILSVLPSNEEEDTAEEIVLEPTPLPSRPKVVDVQPPKWIPNKKLHEPVVVPRVEAFSPPSSVEEATKRRNAAIAKLEAIILHQQKLPPKHYMRRELELDRQRVQQDLSRLKQWIHDEHVSATHRLNKIQIYSAWKLLMQCHEYVPDKLAQAIDQEIPPTWDPNKPEEDEIG